MTADGRPLPVADERSGPFWEAAARHVLVIARCSVCSTFVHPLDSPCPRCRTLDYPFEFVPVSGRGTLRSWTVVRQALLPGFSALVPYVLVDIELEEQQGLRLLGRLLDGMHAPLRYGAPVVTAWEDLSPGLSVPAFELDSSRSRA
jgi:uncharacterized OB-fold protein